MAGYQRWPRIGLLAAGLLLLAGAGAGRADEPKKASPLRESLLKLNGATTEDTQTAKLRELLKDKEKAKKAVAEAVKMMKEAKEDEKPFNYNGTAILARTALILRETAAAERFYEHQVELATKLKSGPKILAAYEGLIDLNWDAKRYAEVVEVCEKLVDMKGPMEVENAKPFIIERLVQAKAKQGKIDEALTMTKGLLELTNDAWYFLQLKGWVQREGGKIDDAITTYADVLEKIDADKNLKGDAKGRIKDRVQYTLSGLYVEKKDVENGAKQLQELIKRNPDSATYKNDLGFIWSDNDLNLEESEKLIKEALELDVKEKKKLKEEGKIDEVKENAAYLDSLGWVLFKQKKYKEALEPLKKASLDEDDGAHLEIWDHLADCYMALGDKKNAIAAWEKALKMDDISKRDGERRRKVSEKLKKARTESSKD
ncbi:tetratricopeptide repeat protein : Tetratricopeptide TPR_2 repeat protein OS=Planctomyces limnophilus (strain ATCC 43296 / DSM 3776 / IFAM 1008 / 290) GN=Plim_2555 PE=4 SV=1: TPR_11 [Gemmataceae bacterium]|nr:tetratricopeptide repeat protein : Tetratricopeptide TPR_2 repeat protein OS=Planctomyces limnophilus (strain ATCC 43296 / DSM 3776 / IFAM 1008 / 290) GN=Plim_2555 PE=4 SV=1: TPR_11 [Gemmataceae bacterium]VTT97157.1 tetratricopeptide repeat protein : Tetratricopeptide TPR_2 repeat protein OS=Planctomyces limnophilus (strain ATCC 43296 / DSM 3776 / IFAM 1008 / 290) GN=Plim_2555 PE=4 SV=1: TPR_11 [Gemmataceae bacterium]